MNRSGLKVIGSSLSGNTKELASFISQGDSHGKTRFSKNAARTDAFLASFQIGTLDGAAFIAV